MNALNLSVLCVLALGWSWYVWPTPWREYHQGPSLPYMRVNRFTGKLQSLGDYGWEPIVKTTYGAVEEEMKKIKKTSATLQQLKYKFPEYIDVPNDVLALRFGRKYPVFLTLDPDFKNEYEQALVTVPTNQSSATMKQFDGELLETNK